MSEQIFDILEKHTQALTALTDALTKSLSITVSDDKRLWTSEQCAQYLGIESARSFSENIAPLPNFPDAVPIPTARSTVRCTRRWVAKEVQDWALSNREKLSMKRRARK